MLRLQNRVRRYRVYCNAQLIQSQNENFLLAKVLDLQILTTHRLVSFVKDQEEKRSFLLWWVALRLAAGAEDTPVLPTVQLPSPSNSRLLGEQGQFYLSSFLLFKGDFLKTVQLVTIVEL